MTNEIINIGVKLAKESGNIKPSALLGFMEVETGGRGFDSATGKIMIQFEPAWYKKFAPYAPSGAWSVNKVDVQSKEWTAFNDAFAKNQEAAMKATSIGLGQIMGFHYQRLGFKTVGDFWDYSKASLENQVKAIVKFIQTDANLLKALQSENWDRVASIYNGAAYKQMAKKWGREPYDISLEKANKKYLAYNK